MGPERVRSDLPEEAGTRTPVCSLLDRKANPNDHISATSVPNPMAGSQASSPSGLDDRDQAEKINQIREACEARDVEKIRKLAISTDGLVNDSLRCSAWPLLLGCHSSGQSPPETKDLPRHRDEDQVELDVHRSFVYYPEGESDKSKDGRKHELSQIIVTVLRTHPMLHYFQGYHDIVQVLFLVLGIDAAFPAVCRLSLLRIRDFMLPTMSGTEPHLRLLPAILYAADRPLAIHLSQTQPFFALPATLTLYAHEIEEYGDIARLFDFLLASEAAISVYLFAVIVLSRKTELLEIEAEEPEMLHSILSKLPKPLNLERLISQTVKLSRQHPPYTLPGRAWAHVSSNSVLKTTQDFGKLSQQTLEDGEGFFHKEAAEIRRQDALIRRQQQLRLLARRYRRPASWFSGAMFVAVLAFYFRGSALPPTILNSVPAWSALQQRLLEVWQRFAV